MRESNINARKKPYSKPQLTAVRLEAAEAVLTGCKVNQGSGPNGHNCRQAGACNAQGS